jgi:hypothetical protein
MRLAMRGRPDAETVDGGSNGTVDRVGEVGGDANEYARPLPL